MSVIHHFIMGSKGVQYFRKPYLISISVSHRCDVHIDTKLYGRRHFRVIGNNIQPELHFVGRRVELWQIKDPGIII